MMSPGEFADLLGRAAIIARNEIDIPVEAVMLAAAESAKEAIGTYKYGWKPLSPSTISSKGGRDTPLLETGKMRDSIKTLAELSPEGAEGLLYSTDPVALWQEMGSYNARTGEMNPPRSFLYASLWRSEPAMGKAFGAFAERIFQIG